MKTRLLGVVVDIFLVASVIIFGSGRAFAITIEAGDSIISNPTYFNGFEAFNGGGFPSYSEGGITVSLTTNASSGSPISSYNYWNGVGQYQWYTAGTAEYTTIRLSNGGNFQSLQFLASSGWIGVINSFLTYIVLEKGAFVASGTLRLDDFCCRTGSGWEYVGFSGGGFDEVRLQDFSVPSNFDLTQTQALALDNISAVGEVPLPAALPLFATGLGALGLLGWRRKRKTAAAA